jgi:hypothetical protein
MPRFITQKHQSIKRDALGNLGLRRCLGASRCISCALRSATRGTKFCMHRSRRYNSEFWIAYFHKKIQKMDRETIVKGKIRRLLTDFSGEIRILSVVNKLVLWQILKVTEQLKVIDESWLMLFR